VGNTSEVGNRSKRRADRQRPGRPFTWPFGPYSTRPPGGPPGYFSSVRFGVLLGLALVFGVVLTVMIFGAVALFGK